MHPLKPYFLGQERPPAPRLTSCQKVFRTVDLDVVGTTARHLTFFEMLGNFSIGDYFKREAVAFAWELSREGYGFPAGAHLDHRLRGRRRARPRPRRGGDRGVAGGRRPARADRRLPAQRELLAGRARPGRAVRARSSTSTGASSSARADDLPGGENARFLEFWNLVFMQYDQQPPDTLTPLPARNIDTGLGLNRMAAILQDVPSVFETDQFRPLIELGETLSGRRYGERRRPSTAACGSSPTTRAAMTFLVADGVVPSNEDRGYVLRRVMRRAIQHGRSLGFEPGFLVRYGELVRELMGAAYPELHEQREAIDVWLASEEESFGRTLEQGLAVLRELIERAREGGGVGQRRRRLPPARHVRLPDRADARAGRRGGPDASTRPASTR